MLALFILLLIIAYRIFRQKSEKTKRRVIAAACLFTIIIFVLYKYAICRDPEYALLMADMGGFNWLGELPFHLCNVNMILIPVAVLTGNEALTAFGFFVAPLSAGMALLMPGIGFDGYSLLLPRMLGYYATHFMILIEGLSLVVFGLYRPRFRDFFKVWIMTMLVAFAAFCLSVFLRRSGLHPGANYFYSIDTEGNAVLELFHKWIPYPYLYLMPGGVILLVYVELVTAGFCITDRIRGRKKRKAA